MLITGKNVKGTWTPVHNYRFKRQTSKRGTFAGVTADALRQATPALAPAIAGWAALEFGFANRPADIRRDEQTGRDVVSWTG